MIYLEHWRKVIEGSTFDSPKCKSLLTLQCTVDNAIKDTFTHILTTSAEKMLNGTVAPPLVIIGGGCPEKTDIIAQMSKFLHAIEASYHSTD